MVFFKALKKTMLVISVMYIAIGVLLIVNKEGSNNIVFDLLAYGLTVSGVISMIKYFTVEVKERIKRSDFVVGAILLSLGILIFVSRETVSSLVSNILAIAMIVSGLHKIQDMFDTSATGYNATGLYLFGFVFCSGLGTLVLCNLIKAPNLYYVVVGLGMTVCGISDLVSNFFVAFRVANKKENKEEE